MTTTPTFPTFFVSHGGGPWPWVDGMKQLFAKTAREFAQMPGLLPGKPKAVLVITGHWEAQEFTVSTAEHPPMEYDYSGFPEHTYRIQYKAPGSKALASRVGELLTDASIGWKEDAHRGFDHGTFVPLSLMYPEADVPVVMLSMKSSYDPAEHIRLGQAIAPLRDEGVLIMGSGLTYHNMRGFGRPQSTPVAEAFEAFLNTAITAPSATQRNDMLVHWQDAPGARLAHPQEDHLIPLMVVAGAAGADVGHRVFVDHAMEVAMASYQFG
ncbi:class III extradiol ring-cleavage dioxygenase [Acidovorax sp. A1169]|uniref:DODA-type extradiol aromatic ring-opening family dioxygenase n=1 Tax=Acidovorax sp. A1169 TaxID=3059524 RepID=UPI002737EDA6|nr:class III extradiol ring-cleavage dioxygenase [Acidovorax sp. A1169]MDP4077721.1 class III extradiol ring-cleavage dioxygenase [Acidovorax sp. A1169]